jgi:hypothetical protein
MLSCLHTYLSDEHLEDTFNNTFRALRVIDPSAPAGQRNLKLAEFTSPTNWDYLQPVTLPLPLQFGESACYRDDLRVHLRAWCRPMSTSFLIWMPMSGNSRTSTKRPTRR